MAQLSNDCFAFGGALLPLEQARAAIAELYSARVGVERVPVWQACGRILAADAIAAMNLPPLRNSAVDGYAVRHADLSPDQPTLLPLHGRAAAGDAPGEAVPPGFASRIFTGAVMPEGPDTVMMQEDCEVTPGGVLMQPGIKPGSNCRPAGADVARGALALAAGRRLTPADIGLLSALGTASVAVRVAPRVTVFSTGNELRDPPDPLAPGQVYDANRAMLMALLSRLGAVLTDGGILPDRLDATASALAAAAGTADLLITSGGVSTGEEDHVRAAIEASGTLTFWRVGIKPGRPVALAEIGGTPLLGLPGNPVAALITFAALGRPLLDRLAGAVFVPPTRFPVASGFTYRKKTGRREYVRVQIGPDGIARRYPKEGAGILTSLTESDALMELPEDMTTLAPGDFAPCTPLGLLYG